MADYWQLQDGSGEWLLQDSSGQWQLQADAASALDEGESSWSMQRGFVQIPIVSAVAALALSVAIANGFKHQDEVPTSLPNTQSESFVVVPIGDVPAPVVFLADEEVIPVAATAIEESEWQRPQWVAPPIQVSGPTWDADTLSWTLDEVYSWTPLTPLYVSPTVTLWTAPDELPTAVPNTQSESWQAVWVGEPDKFYQQWATDDIVPQPAASIFVEDYWLQLRADPVSIAIVEWPGRGAGGPNVAVSTIAVEDYWLQLRAVLLPPARPAFFADEEVIPAQPAEGFSFSSATQRVRYSPTFIQWAQSDELPTPATPLGVDETYWLQLCSIPYAPIIAQWGDTDELPVQVTPLGVDNDYWQPFTPLVVTPTVTVWNNENEPIAILAGLSTSVGFNPFLASPGRMMNRR